MNAVTTERRSSTKVRGLLVAIADHEGDSEPARTGERDPRPRLAYLGAIGGRHARSLLGAEGPRLVHVYEATGEVTHEPVVKAPPAIAEAEREAPHGLAVDAGHALDGAL
jgi:hypothetical protein